MTDVNPPKAAQALISGFIRQQEVDAITGDLLEAYRADKRPALGKYGANVWYVRQALSIAGRVLWPGVVAILVLRIVSFPLAKGWNPSLVPSPGTSILDALVLVSAAYYGAARTGRVITGVLASMLTASIGFGSFFVYAVIMQPALLLAPVQTPFVIVIFCVLLLIASGFAIVAGVMGAAVGRWRHSTLPRTT